MWRICGPKMCKLTQRYNTRSNEETYFAFSEPSILTKVLQGNTLWWSGHVLRFNMIINEVLNWKPQRKKPLDLNYDALVKSQNTNRRKI